MKRYSRAELADFLAPHIDAASGILIRHVASGKDYVIRFVSLRESDLEVLATYDPEYADDGESMVWFTRPLREVQAKFVRTDGENWIKVQSIETVEASGGKCAEGE